MRRILAQTRKELTQIVRDYRTLALALVLPLILLMLLGTAISLTVDDLPDHRAGSRQFARLAATTSTPFARRSPSTSFPGQSDRQPEDALHFQRGARAR